jgi:hypothetical protein
MKLSMENKKQIEQKLRELKSLKLPQLNKKSRAHHDWKLEIERLANLLNKTI